MTPLKLLLRAAEQFGYDQQMYYGKNWATDELIFVGQPDCVIYTPRSLRRHSSLQGFFQSGIRFNPSFRLDIFPMVSWEMDENDIEYIFGAQTREDFETRIEAYLAISIALGRTEEEKR